MFTKKSHQDVKKSTVKIQDSKKDSATRLKHLKIVLEHFDAEEAKTYFENNFSHVYFILYDNFIQAENNLRQRVHKAGREELEGALSLLEKVLCLLPELIGKRWQLHSLTRIFSKLLHRWNSLKLRAEAIRYFLLWYQALGDNAPLEVHRMFATLVPGLPEPNMLRSTSPLKCKTFDDNSNACNESGDFSMEDILHHPNFSTTDNAKKVVVEQTSSGIMGKIVNVSASIFHDTNALNPVQTVEIQPLLPASANEKAVENETKYFFDTLLEAMASSVTKIHWRDRSHAKAMRCFAFLLERFKMYYLPVICPQFNHKNSLYKPNLELPVQHTILEDDNVLCRVILIKWVANYAHFMKKQGSDVGQPSSMTSIGSHLPHSNTLTPATSMYHEEETSFTVGQPVDSCRASPHETAFNTPHPSLESGSSIVEELSSEQVVRDVLCCWSREHVDFTIEVLRQAFLLPFSHAAATRRVIALYKDWIQMNVAEIPPFLVENTYEQQMAGSGEPLAPPRRLRNDSYLGAVGRDNVMVRAGMQNVLQVFMTQAANVFLAGGSPVAAAGGGALTQQQLLDEQTDTCKRVLNIYRYLVMHVAMDANSWEQLLLVLLQITSLVLTKVPPKRKQESLGGFLAPALFQTLIVTWIKANLNVAVKPELWQNFMELLTRLTHWEELITEWAKTMETLTRVLARHVYSLDLSEAASGGGAGGDSRRGGRRGTPAPAAAPLPRPAPLPPPAAHHTATPGKSPKVYHETHPRKEAAAVRRQLARCRSEPHLAARAHTPVHGHAHAHAHAPSPSHSHHTEDTKELISTKSRRWYSLDSLRNSGHHEERDSASGSRSPSPAPSSGVESTSIKDSPLQIDLASDGGNVEWPETDSGGVGSIAGVGGAGPGAEGEAGAGVGVVLGGSARGWLPDVAAVMWRRMLAALGDPNALRDPQAHAQFFKYLIHLNSTLLKISANQTLNGNTEIHVPFNLVAGWCLEAESLPSSHRSGKLLALRLLCESTQAQGPGAPSSCNNRLHLAHLNLYQRALHHGLTGEDRSVVDVLVEHAAPRYLSLALDGYSLLLLDFVHASTIVLNCTDMGPTCPRTAAVTFLGSLLSLPDELMNAPMLQPYPHQYNTVSCPDLKEHVLNIVVRVCRREGAAAARCAGAAALAAHLAQLLAAGRRAPRLPAYLACLLQMLMMKNKSIAKVVSDCILMLADYTDRIVELYPGVAGKIIRGICACLAQISSSSTRDSVKPLAGSLLLCLAEFAVRCGPTYLMQEKDGDQTLLLLIFKVLHAVMKGSNGSEIEGLSLPVDEDFDPNIQLDNLGPKTSPASTIDVKLWAQTICTQLVLFLGHWPLWSGCQVSASVCEQHDSPALGGELGPAVLSAPHVQLLRLSESTLASFVELPALDMPAGAAATTPGLATSDRQVRVLLRDIAGKACWDASALYYDPSSSAEEPLEPLPLPDCIDSPRDNTLSSLPPPLPPDLLPDYKNSPPDKHQLDHVLAYIGHTSPEVSCGRRLDACGPSPLPPGAEHELVAALVAHRNAERHYLAGRDSWEETEASEVCESEAPHPFAQSRRLVAQLGTLAPARRAHAQLLRRSDRLLRELRNLDAQRCRETHKIAVIYVGKGQETRNEILSNRCGSPAYEAFLAALAWEVELESHVGFAGGLRGGGGGGVSAPYVATLTMEALFHVATRMPADTPDAILNKTRHLGNDEVHVVWSEHWRPYKRDTLPTQFCDVLIVLYPLPGGLLRCTVSRKPDVGVFGPLWEEMVVRVECGAALARCAAAAGGRAVRATMPLYQHAYSERARSLHALVHNHTQPATFEHFVQRVREPVPPVPPSHTEQASSRLAAALLDHGANAWGASTDGHSVSPRPTKRLGPFKRSPAPLSAPATAPPHLSHSNPLLPLHTAPTAPATSAATAIAPAPAPAPRRNR
ncbi:probable Rho GTPase-activating protein CG5521 isoform X2 [Galleria mellonella]|uniref:Probable Rho GTPase-activating protein CG5521 isoform X2 n=1 Tax=Galleria mellonella TaxID=7137 RepID=A0ABM3MYD8_GALME|nr:probable Rho GTPase-activating protein CG5521 isoform X2 [Galleria mellonella]